MGWRRETTLWLMMLFVVFVVSASVAALCLYGARQSRETVPESRLAKALRQYTADWEARHAAAEKKNGQ